MRERKTGMLTIAISIAIVLRAIGRLKIDSAIACSIKKALRKKR